MISPLLMAFKQLCEFKKGQIMAYYDCELLLGDITKKLNCHHSSIDVFLKTYKKTRNYHQKEYLTTKEKPLHLKIRKLL